MKKIRNTQIKPRMASMWLSCSSRGIHATIQFVPFIHSFRCCLLGKNSNKKHFPIDHAYNFTHLVKHEAILLCVMKITGHMSFCFPKTTINQPFDIDSYYWPLAWKFALQFPFWISPNEVWKWGNQLVICHCKWAISNLFQLR